MKDYLVRASVMQGYRETSRELGVEPDAILAANGLSGMDTEPDAWISYRAWLHTLEQTASATDCPCFGLRLSERQNIDILGAVGIVMQQAPDLRTALRALNKYFSFHSQGAVVDATVDRDVLSWSFTPKPQPDLRIWQQADLVAGIGIKIMRLLLPDWNPSAIYLPHRAPQDTRPYREIFQCPIHFDWHTTIISSDASNLEAPLVQADPRLRRLVEDHLTQLRKSFPDDYPGKVSYLIRQALQTGDCSIERVSAYLAVNKRTLQRKLRTEGTNYQTLLDDVRFDMACHYLKESGGSLTSLAHMLCYSELSAFTNAFHRYFGMPPRQWREQQLIRSPGAPAIAH